jgi:hypothetical protein
MIAKTARLLEFLERTFLLEPRYFGALLITTCFVASFGQWVLFPINHDVGAILDDSNRLYDGARLYVDIMDFNLPAIFWIPYPAIFLSRLTGMPDTSAITLEFITIVVFSIMVAWRVVERMRILSDVGVRRVFLLGLVWVLIPFSAPHFGQREHLALAGLLPYLLAVAGRANGERLPTRLGLLVGLLAAPACGLKPFFAPVWVLSEAYLYVVAKDTGAWRRIEALMVAIFLLLYAGWVVLWTPYLASLRLVSDVYGAYGASLDVVWSSGNPGFWLGAALSYLLVVVRGSDIHLRRLMLSSLFLFAFSALGQMKGWDYHWHPTQALGWLCILLALASLAVHSKTLSSVFRFPMGGMSVILALIVVVAISSQSRQAIREPDSSKAAVIQRLSERISAIKSGAKVMWLSTDAHPMYPSINYAGARSILRTFLFVLPGVYKGTPFPNDDRFPYHPLKDMRAHEKVAFEWVVEDFAKGKPDVIVVDRRDYKQGFGITRFDFEEYFSRDSRFTAMMEKYEKVSEGQWRIFRLKGP